MKEASSRPERSARLAPRGLRVLCHGTQDTRAQECVCPLGPGMGWRGNCLLAESMSACEAGHCPVDSSQPTLGWCARGQRGLKERLSESPLPAPQAPAFDFLPSLCFHLFPSPQALSPLLRPQTRQPGSQGSPPLPTPWPEMGLAKPELGPSVQRLPDPQWMLSES